MSRPRQPFDQSLSAPLLKEIERFAARHGDHVPTPYRFWRKHFQPAGYATPWSTFYYHWRQLVTAGRLVERDGVYWLPAPQPTPPVARRSTPRRSAPAPTLQLSLGF